MRRAALLMISAFTILFISTTVPGQAPPPEKAERPQAKPQPRPHGQRVAVDPAAIDVDDGDTVTIRWKEGDAEIIRILGIDTPETRHVEHNIPYDQPFGAERGRSPRGPS